MLSYDEIRSSGGMWCCVWVRAGVALLLEGGETRLEGNPYETGPNEQCRIPLTTYPALDPVPGQHGLHSGRATNAHGRRCVRPSERPDVHARTKPYRESGTPGADPKT